MRSSNTSASLIMLQSQVGLHQEKKGLGAVTPLRRTQVAQNPGPRKQLNNLFWSQFLTYLFVRQSSNKCNKLCGKMIYLFFLSVYKCVPAVYYGKCATSGCYSRQRLLNDDITSLEGSINLQEKNIQLIKWLSCKNYSSLLKIWLVLRNLDVPDFLRRKVV